MHLDTKLPLGKRNIIERLPVARKAELCTQAGSQAGAWEPEEICPSQAWAIITFPSTTWEREKKLTANR